MLSRVIGRTARMALPRAATTRAPIFLSTRGFSGPMPEHIPEKGTGMQKFAIYRYWGVLFE